MAGAIVQIEGSWPLRSGAETFFNHITVWHGAVRITNWIQEHLFTEDEFGGHRREGFHLTACPTASGLSHQIFHALGRGDFP